MSDKPASEFSLPDKSEIELLRKYFKGIDAYRQLLNENGSDDDKRFAYQAALNLIKEEITEKAVNSIITDKLVSYIKANKRGFLQESMFENLRQGMQKELYTEQNFEEKLKKQLKTGKYQDLYLVSEEDIEGKYEKYFPKNLDYIKMKILSELSGKILKNLLEINKDELSIQKILVKTEPRTAKKMIEFFESLSGKAELKSSSEIKAPSTPKGIREDKSRGI